MRDKQRMDPNVKKNILGITVCGIIFLCLLLGSQGLKDSPYAVAQTSEKHGLYKLPITYQDNSQGCWEAGDDQFDYDSQAKLIVLTNVYFAYPDNPDVLKDIAYKAIAIRNNAGDPENDCLTEAGDVANLGKALDKASTEGTLSYPLLKKLQRPYISVSEMKTVEADTMVFSFGKVDMELTVTKKLVSNGETTMIDNEVYLTPTAHYQAYVIYLPEFDYSRIDTLGALAASGFSGTDICTVEAFSDEKFADAWNAVGPTASGANVAYVFILTHAQPDELYGREFRFSTYAIEELKHVPIDILIMFGCNAGHFGYMESNPAAALAEKISGGLVLASDSTVQYEPNDDGVLLMTPITDETFSYIIETNGRESMGWLVYQHSAGKIKVYEIGTVSLTVKDMLDFMKTASLLQKYPLIS